MDIIVHIIEMVGANLLTNIIWSKIKKYFNRESQ